MSSIPHPLPETDQDQPTVDERRALIERVAASEHFRRSTRLRDFLLYVGRQSLKEGCPEINEQEVGAHVFGRPSSYDRSQDNIVRVNATELRKRIEAYFETEGAHETLVLEIPRGGYKPLFRRRAAQGESSEVTPGSVSAPATEDAVAPEGNAPEGAAMARPDKRTQVIWAVLCILLLAACALCGFLLQQNRNMRRSLTSFEGKPALASFWGSFLRYRQPTDFVLGDDSFSMIEDIIQHPISLPDYLNRDYMRRIQTSDTGSDRKYDLDQIFAHNLVTFGAVRAAHEILAQMPAASATNLMLSRYYEADAIKRNNVILIGGKKSNPWVLLFDDQLNFSTDFNYETGKAFIANRHPKPGEESSYVAPQYPNALFGYCTIAYLPNPSRTGNVLILAGTDSDATDAAAEFLTSEGDMEKLQGILHVKTLPYFEVLLKTSRLSGTSLNGEMLAYRTYP